MLWNLFTFNSCLELSLTKLAKFRKIFSPFFSWIVWRTEILLLLGILQCKLIVHSALKKFMHFFQLSAKLCKIVHFETENYANNCKIYQQIKSKLEFLKDVDKVDSPGLLVSLRLSVVFSALKKKPFKIWISVSTFNINVWTFWEAHIIWKNLPCDFDFTK